jgi:hypothetical protein
MRSGKWLDQPVRHARRYPGILILLFSHEKLQPIRARPLLVAGWRGTGQCRRYEGDHAELWPERVGLSHKRDPPH